MPDLNEALAGRRALIIVIQDVPTPGEQTSLVQLGEPCRARIEFDEIGTLDTEGVLLTREQALAFAVRITETMGPLDAGD